MKYKTCLMLFLQYDLNDLNINASPEMCKALLNGPQRKKMQYGVEDASG